VVSPVGSSLRKLNTGAQLQTFPYSTVLKSFLYSNAFMAKSGTQSPAFKSVMEKQTKNSMYLRTAGRNPSPTKLGMVIEDLEHVLAPPKLLVSDA